MTLDIRPIDSPESMSAAIRRVGIVPFVHNTVPGWSIEELTAAGSWIWDDEESGVLGPWDWKIEVIREGDIAYGKYIRNKAAFATVEWYRHLMNWRRSQPKYRMAVGEEYSGKSIMDQFYRLFSPVLLDAIKEYGSVEGSDIRKILSERTTPAQRSQLKGHLLKYLLPEVKRTAADYLNQYLEMGTWTIVGDFRRVYRGPNLEYKGWQKSSITTPDELFKVHSDTKDEPFWARFVQEEPESEMPDCTPEESRDAIISKILENFPEASTKELLKLRAGVKDPIKMGQWHAKFSDVKKFADAQNIPLIGVWTNGDACSYCVKLEKCFLDPKFIAWMKNVKCAFWLGTSSDTNADDKYSGTGFKWVRNGTLTTYPFVRVAFKAGKIDTNASGNTVDGKKNPPEGVDKVIAWFEKALEGYLPKPKKEVVIVNPDLTEEEVAEIRAALKKNKGYCPCQVKSKDTKCHCLDFRSHSAPYTCICELYCKVFEDQVKKAKTKSSKK